MSKFKKGDKVIAVEVDIDYLITIYSGLKEGNTYEVIKTLKYEGHHFVQLKGIQLSWLAKRFELVKETQSLLPGL
jgi:hypothetical protein